MISTLCAPSAVNAGTAAMAASIKYRKIEMREKDQPIENW